MRHPSFARLSVSLPIVAGVLITMCSLPAMPVRGSELPELAAADRAALSEVLRELALEHLPSHYQDERQWGGKKRVWNGVRLSFRDGGLDTSRRWRDVNHGTWKRYEIQLLDPDRHLQIRLEHVRQTDEGVLVDVLANARLTLFGRVSEWRRGIQVVSLSADAVADVQLQVSCLVAASLDMNQLPPDVVLHPKVTDAQLSLPSFELQRISNLHGPLVQELGESLERHLQRELNERRHKIIEKMNRQVAQHQEKLRISLRDLGTQGWEEARRMMLGAPGDNHRAIGERLVPSRGDAAARRTEILVRRPKILAPCALHSQQDSKIQSLSHD